ncbi:UDP-N-acetylmuramoyl-tripeptide--D-alanyl-D-alanine ligase [Streptomyces sp. MST-110588]|uniref:UDP-N-acetylmuramoyl-tripeptide--D-alanyl-D- alanine ligase n=1 Tax=Streptomyces sp. MST-110588 TaxID=2833628 RepID=UPI001F5D218F|nr:UDP-N-acetylmuramoyl-tripeptide--D-alanyl-D-alanine ligase [Streptomyces sp. MST-110588]UNO38377.1 UDP-N-acetylmuramoyl-tripeptide--D-alanyl-D-alanine ligase [Streptomyces sp. MST-110588]
MIPLSLGEIAAVVGGRVAGDGAVTVTAPAVLDSRQAEPGSLFVAFAGEYADGHDYAVQAGRAGAVAVLGSRPTALPTIVVEDAKAALQALAAHVVARLRDGLTVVGVTGSRGKTSTKDLLAAVLSSAAPTIATIGSLNNELGVPLTMLRSDAATRFLVLEMGVRRIGDIAELTRLVAPDIGVVLNVGQAHLGHLGSREAIARAKGELVQGLAPGGTAVLNADDPRVAAMRSLTDRPLLTFGRAEHADVRVLDVVLDRLARPSFTLRTAAACAPVALPLVGTHQALNASAAAAVGLAAGVCLDSAAAALPTVSLSKWRLELRDLVGGATLLDDSFNADPDSTRAALDALAAIEGRRRIAVLGEMLELGDDSAAEHRAIGEYAASRADVVVAVGARPLADGAGERAVALTGNAAAVQWLRGRLTAGDVVLVKASRGARLDEVVAALVSGPHGVPADRPMDDR